MKPQSADVIAVVATHNRRETTVGALHRLVEATKPVAERVGVVVVDDASSDGTPQALRTRWPAIRLIEGTGEMYWGGATRVGIYAAMSLSPSAAVLLLNDDTMLIPAGLSRLLEQADGNSVSVGGCGGSEHDLVYGPLLRRRFPFGFEVPLHLAPGRSLDAFQANAVLIPRPAIDLVGSVDQAFVHNMGDIDISLRLVGEGVNLRYAGFVGHSEPNPMGDGRLPRGHSVSERLRFAFGVKGSPLRASLLLFRRHAGKYWFLYWLRYVVARAVRAVMPATGTAPHQSHRPATSPERKEGPG